MGLPSGTVTFVFTDIEGSTRMWEAYGDAMKASLGLHDQISHEVLEGHGGRIFKHTGDGVCAAFASAASAVVASAELQQALSRAEWGAGPELKVRVGVHTGEAMATDDDYLGPALNRVARVMAAGHGGQVLLSTATCAAARDAVEGLEVVDLGEHRLPDLSQPERLYQLGRESFPALRTLDASPNNLPAQVSSFVGRERELETVTALLEEHRLLTLTGVGGTGKTRLALQAAAGLVGRFPDGVFLVELAPLTDAALVVGCVASRVVPRSVQGDLGGDQDEMARLVDGLRERDLLVVLDNCEHLVDAVARTVDRILAECPGVHLLVTSREALGITGEQSWRVPSLSVADADAHDPATFGASESGRLLIDRVRALDPDFEVTPANAGALAEICRRLDGIPLALELAAARVASLSPDEVLTRLGDQFRLLTGGSRTAVERHQTLRAAIDWSYDLLTRPASTLLPRLAVFNGGWTMSAAERACADAALPLGDVLDALTELAEKSLVVAERGDGPTRYRMVEPVRQYALEKLAGAGETVQVRNRHADWVVSELGVDEMDSADASATVARVLFTLGDYHNVVEAVRWLIECGRGADAGRVLAGCQLAFMANGQYREGLTLSDLVLSDGEAPCWAVYSALTFSVYLALWLGEVGDAERRVAEAESVGTECPEVSGRFWGVLAQASVRFATGGLGHLVEELEAAREDARAVGSPYTAEYASFILGTAYSVRGDYERAVALISEAYEGAKAFPVGWVPYAPANMAVAKVYAGHDDAHEAVELAERVAREVGDPAALASALIGRILVGTHAEARQAVEEVAGVVRKIGLRGRFARDPMMFYAARFSEPVVAARALGRATDGLQDLFDWHARIADQIRVAIGVEAFDAAFEAGRHMTAEALLDEILATPVGPAETPDGDGP